MNKPQYIIRWTGHPTRDGKPELGIQKNPDGTGFKPVLDIEGKPVIAKVRKISNGYEIVEDENTRAA